MAFIKDKTTAAQTAANASAVVIAAFSESFKSFDDAVEAFDALRANIFADLAEVVDGDNKAFAAAEGTKPAAKSNGSGSKKSYDRGSKTRGGKSSGISLEDSLGMELNFGAFQGETLATVLGLDADEAEDDYGYGDGERSGRDYIAWLASDKNQNEYVQRRARVIADSEGIDY